jgi:hypothetical protein
VAGLLEQGIITLIGHDKQGRSLLFIKPRKIKTEKLTSELFMKGFYYQVRKALNECKPKSDQYYIIIDFKDSGFSNFQATHYTTLVPVLNAVLIDRLHKMVILNTNWFVEFIFSFMAQFLSKRTQKQFAFYSNEFDYLKNVI